MKNTERAYYYSNKKIYEILPNGDCDIYTLTGEILSRCASVAMDGFVLIGNFETIEQASDKVLEMGYKHYEELAMEKMEEIEETDPVFYYDKKGERIWVVGEDWCWPSRTHIYSADGEYIDFDDSGFWYAKLCDRLDCSTLEEAVEIVKQNYKKETHMYFCEKRGTFTWVYGVGCHEDRVTTVAYALDGDVVGIYPEDGYECLVKNGFQYLGKCYLAEALYRAKHGYTPSSEELKELGIDNQEKHYYVYSFYEMHKTDGIDILEIGVATEEDKKNSGDNYVGGGQSYSFTVYPSLREAILNSGFIADKIKFVKLPEEDEKEAKEIVSELMADETYLNKFGLSLRTLYVSVYNRKTKEVVECVLYNQEDIAKIKVGDVIDYYSANSVALNYSGVIVDIEERDMDRSHKYPYLYVEEHSDYTQLRVYTRDDVVNKQMATVWVNSLKKSVECLLNSTTEDYPVCMGNEINVVNEKNEDLGCGIIKDIRVYNGTELPELTMIETGCGVYALLILNGAVAEKTENKCCDEDGYVDFPF